MKDLLKVGLCLAVLCPALWCFAASARAQDSDQPQDAEGRQDCLEGPPDNQGNAATNQVLSESRAQAAVAWLVGHGVRAGRLTAEGSGQARPVADNATDDGRAKNRRVELAQQ